MANEREAVARALARIEAMTPEERAADFAAGIVRDYDTLPPRYLEGLDKWALGIIERREAELAAARARNIPRPA
jgi:hypothetical protein